MKYKIKKIENMSLLKQLIIVTLVALAVCSVILGIILPRVLEPFYEKSVYAYLRQPSKFIEPNTNKMSDDIAFIIVTKGGAVYTSDNINKMFEDLGYEDIITLADKEQGKFEVNKKTYYYLWGNNKRTEKLNSNRYISNNRTTK